MNAKDVSVGKLSDFFSVEEKDGVGFEYKTSLEGMSIKLSRELMDELGSGWHSLHPQEVTIKLMGKPTRFGVWMKDCNEGYVSRIVYESIPGLGEQKKWGVVLGCSPNSNTETVVITALESVYYEMTHTLTGLAHTCQSCFFCFTNLNTY